MGFKIFSDGHMDGLEVAGNTKKDYSFIYSVFYSFFAIKEILLLIKEHIVIGVLRFGLLSFNHHANAEEFYKTISKKTYRMDQYKTWRETDGIDRAIHYHEANRFQYIGSLGFSFDLSDQRINNRSYVKSAHQNYEKPNGKKQVRRITVEDDELLKSDVGIEIEGLYATFHICLSATFRKYSSILGKQFNH
jgi:hypothetical protein